MSDLENAIAVIKEKVEFYQKLEGTEIPASVKEASQQNWKLQVDELNLQGILHYKEEDRHDDSLRIIPLSAALTVIRETEEELIKALTLDPIDILFVQFAGKWALIKYAVAALGDWEEITAGFNFLWSILKNLAFDFAGLNFSSVRTALNGVLLIFENLSARMVLTTLEFAAVITIAAEAQKVLKHRDDFLTKMRKRALPGGKKGQRWPRRKRTRR